MGTLSYFMFVRGGVRNGVGKNVGDPQCSEMYKHLIQHGFNV